MRLLFVKESLGWPLANGHDVHCFHRMQALARLGHEVSLLTATEPPPPLLERLQLTLQRTFPTDGKVAAESLRLSRLQERFRSYWGVSPARIAAVPRVAEECRADAVIVDGLNALPYLGAVEGRCRVWHAGDEWAWHHLSQIQLSRPSTWSEIRLALIKGLYEHAYGSLVDRIWLVTKTDRRAMRWVTGVRNIDVIPNGVDGEHYRPIEQPQGERSCVFWGRLDFGPNIQALQWFCQRIWPSVRRQAPDARFTIYGFCLSEPVRALACQEGVTIIPDLPDLRAEVARHQVVVLPVVSGGGIKNKLLEAASMGKAIVSTAKACLGLRLEGPPPLLAPHGIQEWVQALLSLWQDADRRNALGSAARLWVLKNHSWTAMAQEAVASLESRQR
ncbi:MAG TPA: glycosyltransferase family 4 protein [Gemmataceae bacterium]|nr:glycosyltransferase family 4 protein [Gemmataceae bacterium]